MSKHYLCYCEYCTFKKEILPAILWIVAIILLIDFIGFCAWIFSSQIPVGNMYIGTITAHLFRFFLKII